MEALAEFMLLDNCILRYSICGCPTLVQMRHQPVEVVMIWQRLVMLVALEPVYSGFKYVIFVTLAQQLVTLKMAPSPFRLMAKPYRNSD